MSRRTRTIRYGGSILVVLVGVVCGIAIPGTAGGTLATVFVGLGLVGVVSLIFYEVGLTEDRERDGRRAADGSGNRDGPAAPLKPDRPATDESHDGPRRRPTERVRDHRRRLR